MGELFVNKRKEPWFCLGSSRCSRERNPLRFSVSAVVPSAGDERKRLEGEVIPVKRVKIVNKRNTSNKIKSPMAIVK